MSWEVTQRITGKIGGIPVDIETPVYVKLGGLGFANGLMEVVFTVWGNRAAYESGEPPHQSLTMWFGEDRHPGDPPVLDPLDGKELVPAGPECPSLHELPLELREALDVVKRRLYQLSQQLIPALGVARKV